MGRQEPHRHAGSGAQEANGEGRDQGRDRGRPASPAGSPRARPEHAGYVHRVNPREAPTGCLRTNPRSEARAHLPQTPFAVLNPEPKRVLRAEGALRCFSETARSKSRSRAPPAASGGVRHVAGGWGKSTPSHQPRALGSFLGVKAKPLRGRCASLDPHPLRQCPSSPCAGLWRVFSGGRVKGWCGPQPRRGEDTALTRPGDPSLPAGCRGRSSPGTPAPRREAPAGSPEALIKACGAGGTPAGVQGRAALGPSAANKNPLPKASIFCSSSFALRLFTAPRRGLNLRETGEPRKATNSGVLGFPM